MIPEDFHFDLLEPDWEDFAAPLAAHHHRVPATREAEIVKFVNGPESFTPDNNFLMGEPAGARGLFVLAGFNSAGIACAGGAGLYAAEWMESRRHDHRTCSRSTSDASGRATTGASSCKSASPRPSGMHYSMAWPGRQMETARNLAQTPLYETHAANGARFGESSGVERPLWFGGAEPGYTFGKPPWLGLGRRRGEARAARASPCSTSRPSPSSRLSDAALLQRLCANDIDVAPGRAIYTAMLNTRGTFESDLTVVREREDAFYLVSSTASRHRDLDWLRRGGAGDDLRDVTEEVGVLGVMGPGSRELLAGLTDTDLSHGAFPFGAARDIEVAGHRALAIRITYVGELGWELHLPADLTTEVHSALKAAGARDAGHHSIGAMRVEKAYRAFGHELSPDETPLEAGLGFAVAWDTDFLGREALEKKRAGTLEKRLASFVLEDPDVMLWGGEPIVSGAGEVLGHTTSATFGPTLGAAVAMGYLREGAGDGRYAIVNAGTAHAAKMTRRAPFDPGRERVLC